MNRVLQRIVEWDIETRHVDRQNLFASLVRWKYSTQSTTSLCTSSLVAVDTKRSGSSSICQRTLHVWLETQRICIDDVQWRSATTKQRRWTQRRTTCACTAANVNNDNDVAWQHGWIYNIYLTFDAQIPPPTICCRNKTGNHTALTTMLPAMSYEKENIMNSLASQNCKPVSSNMVSNILSDSAKIYQLEYSQIWQMSAWKISVLHATEDKTTLSTSSKWQRCHHNTDRDIYGLTTHATL